MIDFPQRLIDGYGSFRANRLAGDAARYRRLAERGQSPQIMIVGCSDSRAAPETVFDAAPGELFVHRNVANLVPPHDPDSTYHGTSAAIEFAVTCLAVRHIVVMGHGRCGGVTAFLHGGAAGGDYISKWISLMAPARDRIAAGSEDPGGQQRAMELASIRNSLDNLGTFSFVRERLDAGGIGLHGAWFDIASGEMVILDPVADGLRPAL